MNEITILIWITIAIIAIIAIILVRLHYRGEQLENDEGTILPNGENLNKALSLGKDIIHTNSHPQNNGPRSLSPQNSQDTRHSLFRNQNVTSSRSDAYIVPEVQENMKNYEYASQNQVLINYDNTVEKFQEPIKQSQMDIMTQNNKNEENSDLKDLFTIDELIKESKRKDSEREKESQKIHKEENAEELETLKESIKNKTETPLIEEVISEQKEDKISDLVKDSASETTLKDTVSESEPKKEVESVSSATPIKQVNEIEMAELKEPKKVDRSKDYKMGASIDDANLFGSSEEGMDLDYRKDLDKFANKIKGSKIFQEVKEKLTPEPPEVYPPYQDERFIRNVNEYDEYEPIINETHLEYDATYDEYHDFENTQSLRQRNTRRVFKNSPIPEQSPIGSIKDKPVRDNIKITISNTDYVLKKGDEIIFNHLGETYSSQVYAINGDDISVKYRRKNITIKPKDVKKIY